MRRYRVSTDKGRGAVRSLRTVSPFYAASVLRCTKDLSPLRVQQKGAPEAQEHASGKGLISPPKAVISTSPVSLVKPLSQPIMFPFLAVLCLDSTRVGF